jgi:hypothetical protein
VVIEMDAQSYILLIILSIILGMAGQFVRVVVNLKDDAYTNKEYDDIDNAEKTLIDSLYSTGKKVKPAPSQSDISTNEAQLDSLLKKEQNKGFDLGQESIPKTLGIALLVGFIVGLLACVYESSQGTTTIDIKFIALITATGYAGSDAVEGIIDSIVNQYKSGKNTRELNEYTATIKPVEKPPVPETR